MSSQIRRVVIAGNWKMFKTPAEAKTFTDTFHQKVDSVLSDQFVPEVVLCPPYTALAAVKEAIDKLKAPFKVAAQNMESRENGAYTGEISPLMLKDLGVQVVVIGHSERRQYYNETDTTVNQKLHAALKHNLTPIVCVGETLDQRDAGTTDDVIRTQIEKAFEKISATKFPEIIVAYEPVWAIGTGKTCDAIEANRVCKLIRDTLTKLGDASKTRILYGGSVKPDNTFELISKSDIDGALVGGASLNPDDFSVILFEALKAAKSLPVSP